MIPFKKQVEVCKRPSDPPEVTDKLFCLNNTSRSETKFVLIIHVDASQVDKTLQSLRCAISIVVTMGIIILLGR